MQVGWAGEQRSQKLADLVNLAPKNGGRRDGEVRLRARDGVRRIAVTTRLLQLQVVRAGGSVRIVGAREERYLKQGLGLSYGWDVRE